mmetsp:Transcript_24103/g.90947  ORF Transcript_24103/g.90947 Transcript_24103/m.90947 type:complete len:482 (-) Transcript_24103:129-1574(-)
MESTASREADPREEARARATCGEVGAAPAKERQRSVEAGPPGCDAGSGVVAAASCSGGSEVDDVLALADRLATGKSLRLVAASSSAGTRGGSGEPRRGRAAESSSVRDRVGSALALTERAPCTASVGLLSLSKSSVEQGGTTPPRFAAAPSTAGTICTVPAPEAAAAKARAGLVTSHTDEAEDVAPLPPVSTHTPATSPRKAAARDSLAAVVSTLPERSRTRSDVRVARARHTGPHTLGSAMAAEERSRRLRLAAGSSTCAESPPFTSSVPTSAPLRLRARRRGATAASVRTTAVTARRWGATPLRSSAVTDAGAAASASAAAALVAEGASLPRAGPYRRNAHSRAHRGSRSPASRAAFIVAMRSDRDTTASGAAVSVRMSSTTGSASASASASSSSSSAVSAEDCAAWAGEGADRASDGSLTSAETGLQPGAPAAVAAAAPSAPGRTLGDSDAAADGSASPSDEAAAPIMAGRFAQVELA